MLAAIGVCVFAFYLSAAITWRLWTRPDETVLERWRRVVGLEADDRPEAGGTAAGEEVAGEALRRLLGWVRERVGVRANSEQLDHYRRLLAQAGHPLRLSAEEVAASRVVSALAFGIGALLLTGFRPTVLAPVLLAVAVLFGYRFPIFWLQRRAAFRRRQMQRELVTFVDHLTLTAEVRGNLETAIEYVARKAPGVLSGEFLRALRRVQYGAATLEDALTEVGSLSEIPELMALCNALVQGRRRGTPVASTLRIESESLKRQRVHRAEAEAGKATVKLVIPMIVCFFMPLLVLFLGPTLVQFGRVLSGG